MATQEPLEAELRQPPPADPLRTAAFVALAVAMAVALASQQWEAIAKPRARPEVAQPPPHPADLRLDDLWARYAVFGGLNPESLVIPAPEAQPARVAQRLGRTADEHPHPVLLRRSGIVGMLVAASDEHYRRLLRAAESESPHDPQRAAVERELWAALYQPEPERPLTPQQWQRLEPILDELQLGWYADVVRMRAYKLLGREEEAKKAGDAVVAVCQRRLVPVVLLSTVLALAAIGGLIGGIVVLARLLSGGLTPVGVSRGLSARPLWETVILALIVFQGFYWVVQVLGAWGWRPAGVGGKWLLGLAGQIAMACAFLWLRGARPPIRPADVGWKTRRWGTEVLFGLAGYAMTLPLLAVAALAVAVLQQWFPGLPPPSHPAVELLEAQRSPLVAVGLFAMASVVAPLMEETLFRGLLQGAIRQRRGALEAAAASAVVFAFVHPQGPLGLLPLFTLGMSFALLYEWRGSLIPGIVAHAVNNAVVLTFLYLVL